MLSVPQLSVAAGRTQTRFGVDEWPDVQASLLCAGVASLFLRRASHWDWSLESVPNSLVFMTHLSKDIVAFADAHEVEHCAHFATNTKVWHGDSSCTLCVLEVFGKRCRKAKYISSTDEVVRSQKCKWCAFATGDMVDASGSWVKYGSTKQLLDLRQSSFCAKCLPSKGQHIVFIHSCHLPR